MKKKSLQGLKRQNKLFANNFAETSDELLINISSKTEMKTKSDNLVLNFIYFVKPVLNKIFTNSGILITSLYIFQKPVTYMNKR